jgi:hypothetical protein
MLMGSATAGAGSAAAQGPPTYPPIEITGPASPTPCSGPSSIPPIAPADVNALEARVTTFTGRALAGIGQCGHHLVVVTLTSGNERLAARVRATFGPSIQIMVGLTVWNGHPGRSPRCGSLAVPSSPAPGYSSTLHLRTTTLRVGQDLEGVVDVRDIGTTPVRVLTDSPIEVVLTKPGTRRVVGIFGGGIAGSAYGALLTPGAAKAIGIVGGTSRCDGGLGSALPPGHYDAVAEVSGPAVDGPEGPPPTTFTQFLPVRIVGK